MIPDVIKIDRIHKKFEGVTAVNDLTLRIKKGEMFGIVGPDGAGKTTLIRMLCGIYKPDSGSGSILDYDLIKGRDSIKNHIGYLSQQFSLYGDLSISENIDFFAKIHNLREFRDRKKELLEMMRLDKFEDRLADKLSGGMKQKLALACTLIHTPRIIFLDEPTTGVDPVSRREFWRILSGLIRESVTIVLATPYMDEAERCSRVALMNKGKFLDLDKPQSLKSGYRYDVVELISDNIKKSAKLLKRVKGIEINDVQVFGDRIDMIMKNADEGFPVVLEKLKKNDVEIREWRIKPPSIENVFISSIRNEARSQYE